jgi:hypothetical protein
VHETRVKAREAAKQKKAKVAQMLAEIYGVWSGAGREAAGG